MPDSQIDRKKLINRVEFEGKVVLQTVTPDDLLVLTALLNLRPWQKDRLAYWYDQLNVSPNKEENPNE